MTNTTSPIADALAEVQSINQAVDRPAPKRKTASKPKAKAKKRREAKATKPAAKKTARKAADKKPAEPKALRVTKESQAIEMLSRKDGTSNEELQEAFGWQPHTVRGLVSTLKSKRGLTINRDKESGRYTIPSE